MPLQNITYDEIVQLVKNYIKANCINIANYSSLPACYKPGYKPKIQFAGKQGYAAYHTDILLNPIFQVSASTVDTDMNNFLTTIKINDKLSDNIPTSEYINLINDMVSFCSSKCCFTISQYDSGKYLVYNQATGFISIKELTTDEVLKIIEVEDIKDILNSLIQVINQNIRVTPATYNISLELDNAQYQQKINNPDIFTTAGTYYLYLWKGQYELTACGAGGGGGSSCTKYGHVGQHGGSGAAFKGVVNLNEGTYEIVVGTGGNAAGNSSGRHYYPGYNGTDTKISLNSMSLLFLGAGHGGGGSGRWTINGGNDGKGGTLKINSSLTVVSKTISQDGITGSNVSILGNNYGKGGTSGFANANGTNGTGGYVKIQLLKNI